MVGFLLWFFWSDMVGAVEAREVLSVGESRKITLPFTGDAKVSQKGIIEMVPLGEGQWDVTALKRGVVFLTPLIAESSVKTPRAMIEVRGSITARGVEALFRDPSWRQFLCSQPRARCDDATFTIHGETDSYVWLHKAQQLCGKEEGCALAVNLSASGQKSLRHSLQSSLGRWFRIHVLASGRSIAWARCGEKGSEEWEGLADHVTGGMVQQHSLKVLCEQEAEVSSLIVKAKAFFLKRDEAESLGLRWDRPVPATMVTKGTAFSPQIDNFLDRHRQHIVSEPVLRLRSKEVAEVHTGSELRYLKKENEEDWKRVGFALQLKAVSTHLQGALLSYRMELSQPQAAENVQSSLLVSEVNLPYGEGRLVGELDMVAAGESNTSFWPLDRIPIIAPFFKFLQSSESRSRLYLMLMLVKDDGASVLPMTPAWR